MSSKRVRVRITEVPSGWESKWSDGRSETHATACMALRAVQAHGQQVAEGGDSSVIVIEWAPITRLGRQVVRALQ